MVMGAAGLRSAMGLFAPIFGAVADRRGYRPVMQISLLGAAGLIWLGLSRNVWMAASGMIRMGLGFTSFAAQHARLPGARGCPMRSGAAGHDRIFVGFDRHRGPVRGGPVDVCRLAFFLLLGGNWRWRWSWAGCPKFRPHGHGTAGRTGSTAPLHQRAVAFFDLGEHAGSTYATTSSPLSTFSPPCN
ncbi:MAG: hypothetical protein R3A10_13970 [Caldilineaceae bacterium]